MCHRMPVRGPNWASLCSTLHDQCNPMEGPRLTVRTGRHPRAVRRHPAIEDNHLGVAGHEIVCHGCQTGCCTLVTVMCLCVFQLWTLLTQRVPLHVRLHVHTGRELSTPPAHHGCQRPCRLLQTMPGAPWVHGGTGTGSTGSMTGSPGPHAWGTGDS